MIEIKNYSRILGFLYRNEVEFMEEISIIERMYLYPDILVFVDNPEDISGFILMQKNHIGNISVYMKIGNNEDYLQEAYNFLNEFEKVHIQCDKPEKEFLKDKLKISGEYQYQIMKFNPSKFKPIREPVPIPITPDLPFEDLNELSAGNGHRFREEIRHGVFYGYKIKNKWAAFAGAGVLSRNCLYLYVNTESEFRGRGLGKCSVSFCIEEILRRGKNPVYALDPKNIPSMKIAKYLGFEPFITKVCLFGGKWKVIRKPGDDKKIPDSSFFA